MIAGTDVLSSSAAEVAPAPAKDHPQGGSLRGENARPAHKLSATQETRARSSRVREARQRTAESYGQCWCSASGGDLFLGSFDRLAVTEANALDQLGEPV